MLNLARKILQHKYMVLILFVGAMVLSVFLDKLVVINYDLAKYLPQKSPSTVAIHTLMDEFHDGIPNLDLMVEGLSVSEALALKTKLEALPYVDLVMWLDTVEDMATPVPMMDKQVAETYYKNETALYHLNMTPENFSEAIEEVREVCAPHPTYMAGGALDSANASESASSEMATIMSFALPLGLTVLAIFTTSWFEPVLFLVCLVPGILLNNGTNIFLHEISFITKAVSAILQLAVSMDYAIFLLERFRFFREEGMDDFEAMAHAMQASFVAISSSALTTLFGFLALVFMRFRLGADLGLVMAKGIFFSLFSIMLFMPCFTMLTLKYINKTQHRSFIPDFAGFCKFILKVGPLLILLAAFLVVPAFLAQQRNNFFYGNGPLEGKRKADYTKIEENFGVSRQLAVMVPKGDPAKELALTEALGALPGVQAVVGYANRVGTGLPTTFIPDTVRGQLISENYSRYIIMTPLPNESPETFAFCDKLKETVAAFYPGTAHLAGEMLSNNDIRITIQRDNKVVNILSILAIGLTILFSFKSLGLPLILVFSIEFAIWLNLSFPYFQNHTLSYIGYLVISSIQLGATVDYGILVAQRYLEYRTQSGLLPKQAAYESIHISISSLLPPGLILMLVGYLLNYISSMQVVQQIGMVLGRGALMSLIVTIFLTTNFLYLADPLLARTTQSMIRLQKEGKLVHSPKRRKKKEAEPVPSTNTPAPLSPSPAPGQVPPAHYQVPSGPPGPAQAVESQFPGYPAPGQTYAPPGQGSTDSSLWPGQG